MSPISYAFNITSLNIIIVKVVVNHDSNNTTTIFTPGPVRLPNSQRSPNTLRLSSVENQPMKIPSFTKTEYLATSTMLI